MVYLGRIVIVGNYQGNPFVGNVLQSRSERERVIKPWRNGANVVPSEAKLPEVIEQLRKGNLSITHNAYPCIFGFEDKFSNPYIVACNGRFAGAIRRKINRGDSLEDAISASFDASDPKPGDPRLVAVARQFQGISHYKLGAFDVDKLPYWHKEMGIEINKAKYIASNSRGEISEISVGDIPPGQLAEYFFAEILGKNPEFGIGAAICMLKGDIFKINVFNVAV